MHNLILEHDFNTSQKEALRDYFKTSNLDRRQPPRLIDLLHEMDVPKNWEKELISVFL